MFEDDEHFDTFAFDFVWLTNSGGFGHRWVANQTRLNLHRTEAVTTDFDDVVYATLDAEVAFFVFGSGITGEVDILDGVPVGFITGWIAENGAHLGRPRVTDDQEATLVRTDRFAVLVHDIGLDGWKWLSGTTWLERQNDGRTDQDHAGFCL